MKRNSGDREETNKRSREHVLTRVLLHMVAAARGVNLARELLTKPGSSASRRKHVEDSAILFAIEGIDHAPLISISAQRSGVERLATAGGIKSRAVQNDCRLATCGRNLAHNRVEAIEKRV